RQNRAAAGFTVRGAAGILQAAAGSDRPAARPQAQIGRALKKASLAMAQSAADAIIAIPIELGGAPMANVPGVVTDPSRIKGGVIALSSGGTNIAAYLATPHQPGNYPGIVVIQEAFGLVDHICDLARRFANIGYNACAPALYWRRGGPKNPDSMDDVRPVMFGLPDSEAVQDLDAAAAY